MKLHTLVGCLMLVTTTAVHAQPPPTPNQPANGWIATPAFTAPLRFQTFTLAPGLVVHLHATIPKIMNYTMMNPFDFVQYALASPFIEKWHIDLVRVGPHNTKIALQSFEGLITGDTFGIDLNSTWFKNAGGPGTFGAVAYLLQIRPDKRETGMETGVGFNIDLPLASFHDLKPGTAAVTKPQYLPFAVAGAPTSVPYDIVLHQITVKPGERGSTTYQEGEKVAVSCSYSVVRKSTSVTWQPLSWNRYLAVDGRILSQQSVMIAPPRSLQSSKAFEGSWTAHGPGPHKISCGMRILGYTDKNLSNNEAVRDIFVTAFGKTLRPGPTNESVIRAPLPLPHDTRR